MKAKVRPTPKGRSVDPKAREEVRQLLGDASRQRDLLIEHLHRINDRHGHLPAPHLAALAQEMRLPLAEVYEVATFYHHFEVVKEGETAPAALAVRVCDSIACELAGAQALLSQLSFGSAGPNSLPQLAVWRVQRAAGNLDFTHVPYPRDPPHLDPPPRPLLPQRRRALRRRH